MDYASPREINRLTLDTVFRVSMRFFEIIFRRIRPRSRRNFEAIEQRKWTNPNGLLQDCHAGVTPSAETTRYDRQREACQLRAETRSVRVELYTPRRSE